MIKQGAKILQEFRFRLSVVVGFCQQEIDKRDIHARNCHYYLVNDYGVFNNHGSKRSERECSEAAQENCKKKYLNNEINLFVSSWYRC